MYRDLMFKVHNQASVWLEGETDSATDKELDLAAELAVVRLKQLLEKASYEQETKSRAITGYRYIAASGDEASADEKRAALKERCRRAI